MHVLVYDIPYSDETAPNYSQEKETDESQLR